MTAILGISAFYHDAAAALLVDGQLLAAAQEDRFTRRKHDPSFPTRSVQYCLDEAGLQVDQLEHVVFYEKPFRKLERVLETFLAHSPRGYSAFRSAIPIWLREKLFQSRSIVTELNRLGSGKYTGRPVFVQHHQAHAASAFFASPFERAAILTADGVGEWATTTVGQGDSNQLELCQQIEFPDSLGLLYAAFTAFCGFHVNGGEGKLMGLAAFGEPVFANTILEHLVDLKPDGSFQLNHSFFGYQTSNRMTNRNFERLFRGPPRSPNAPITDRERNLASSIQSVTEEILLRMARHCQQVTGQSNLCLAGGVALNCVANGRLAAESGFENVWVQPAAGDAGGALGAALFAWHQLLDSPRKPHRFDPCLGPAIDIPDCVQRLSTVGASFDQFQSAQAMTNQVAKQIAIGKVVGWMQGRMEFGPRALGRRSILADPRNAGMQDTVNRKVKFREPFRPFAPAVLQDQASNFFELPTGGESPYMLFAAKVKKPAAGKANSLDSSGTRHSIAFPAITHRDGTARVQTVAAADHPELAQLLRAFQQQTGCPMLLNTSLNLRGQPMACTLEDALDVLMHSELDLLVIGNVLLGRDQQPADLIHRLAAESGAPHSRLQSVWKQVNHLFYRVTFPIRWTVSEFVLLMLFFGLFTPLGWLLRSTGSLNSRHRRELDPPDSYWIKSESKEQLAQFFKPF
jgi:carbamoyltransferase